MHPGGHKESVFIVKVAVVTTRNSSDTQMKSKRILKEMTAVVLEIKVHAHCDDQLVVVAWSDAACTGQILQGGRHGVAPSHHRTGKALCFLLAFAERDIRHVTVYARCGSLNATWKTPHTKPTHHYTTTTPTPTHTTTQTPHTPHTRTAHHHTTPHHTTPHHTTPHHTTPHHNTTQDKTTQDKTRQDKTRQDKTHSTLHTPQHSTTLHNTPQPSVAILAQAILAQEQLWIEFHLAAW